ncbi:MAG: SDR family oxidoreductase [Caldilineaceae bacterium]|nr:SDR family oxidoreductase [Caldilineaceae bacterium]
MNVLIAGASGATGRLLVEQLLDRGIAVRIIVRPQSNLPESFTDRENLTIARATLLDLDDKELADQVRGCDAIASCLGHNLTFKGVYGQPRRLVTDATRRLCNAAIANQPETHVKFVLMNTVGNRNRDLNEEISLAQKGAIGLMRLLLPPQADNEEAAEFLRTEVGQNHAVIEWAAVRPDSLTDDKHVTPYDEYPSPIRSALFDPGKTSRINVAHFMAELITNPEKWDAWKGQMPVIYNSEAQ